MAEKKVWARACWDEGVGKNMVATVPLSWVDQVEKIVWWPNKNASKMCEKHAIPGKDWLKFKLEKVKHISVDKEECDEYLETEVPEDDVEEITGRRKRKVPAKLMDYRSDYNSEDERRKKLEDRLPLAPTMGSSRPQSRSSSVKKGRRRSEERQQDRKRQRLSLSHSQPQSTSRSRSGSRQQSRSPSPYYRSLSPSPSPPRSRTVHHSRSISRSASRSRSRSSDSLATTASGASSSTTPDYTADMRTRVGTPVRQVRGPSLEDLQKDIRKVGALVLTCLEELRQFKAQYGAETETPLPNFTTVEEVMDFAPDDAKKTELVSRLTKMGGLNARKGISAIMNRLMSNAVMSQLNMTGAGPQKKAAFEKSTLCQIILDAVVRRFQVSESEVRVGVMKHLKDAKGRMRKSQQENKENELRT